MTKPTSPEFVFLGGIPRKVVTVVGLGGEPLAGGTSTRVTITRPADAVPYTAGDVVGGALTVAGIAQQDIGGDLMLSSIDLRIDLAAIPAGMTSFRLHLYNVTPPSAYADNAAWDLPASDRNAYLGFVDLGLPADMGSTLYTQVDAVGRHITLNSDSLFAYLVTNGGYTPGPSDVLALTVRGTGV